MIDYTNPCLLNYTLANDIEHLQGLKVFRNYVAETFAGKMEMAIIGSSHYLVIENKMCEILSCHQPEKRVSLPLILKHVTGNFEEQYSFQGFHYHFKLQFNQFSPEEFCTEEDKLRRQSFELFLPFSGVSAITAIRLQENSPELLIVSTWHTYPETGVIIETESKFW